jgi:topoisomerase-4 subunit A
MAYVQQLFQKNFLEYASYVIKDRAIPNLEDGLKPVQRRILHSLFEMDDGKFHKVANVVGHCMKYHPHGDASIYEALVVLANKDLFIDTQGNFGNLFTGDMASAARYIECRVLGFAKQVMYHPELTQFDDSYDGRNKEPVTFPAKIPVVILIGAEGIAVGMSTKILPHNFVEVITAMKADLQGQPFQVLPDFPTGGILDASQYADGLGKVLVRAKLDISDPKRIVIRELPFGQTTESLIESIENAARRGKLKIAGIQDFTTEFVEIEIQLARGVYTQDTVDALYAFTDCETSISCNLLVIKENIPIEMTVTEVIRHQTVRLKAILQAELELELKRLEDKLHARTLERIFIEERIYKQIEDKTTAEGVQQAVIDGFDPFAKEIRRPIVDDDVETLLKIPIRRISLFDINKARKEIAEIEAELKKIKHHLLNIVLYALDFLDKILALEGPKWPRQTTLASFDKVNVREVAVKNLVVRYDLATGYLGRAVNPSLGAGLEVPKSKSGKTKVEESKIPRVRFSNPDSFSEGKGIVGGVGFINVSEFDKLVQFRTDGSYLVTNHAEKQFVGQNLLVCTTADKENLASVIFTVIYQTTSQELYVKRFAIESYIQEKIYSAVPDGGLFVAMTIRESGRIRCNFLKKPGMRVFEDEVAIEELLVKSAGAQGNRLTNKNTDSLEILAARKKN